MDLPPVSLVRCTSYDLPEVEACMRQMLEPLGGMGAFVAPGQRVLLKPNLLAPFSPERGVTTHPVVVEAAARLVREAGGSPFLIDSGAPVGPQTQATQRLLYRATGMLEMAGRIDLPLSYDSRPMSVSTPDGRILKRLDLLGVLEEADVVIALPKFKTHTLTTITGATKILFGLVPGVAKPGYHAKLQTLERFCEMLLDIVAYVRPALYLMDGVVGMEGDGPNISGTLRPVNALLASTDAVAMDAAMCAMMQLDPERLTLFQAARQRGWWDGTLPPLLGTPLQELLLQDFRLPATADVQPGRPRKRGLMDLFTGALGRSHFVLRPVPKEGRCIGCGVCVRMCPQDAITVRDKLARVDYGACIRCYCCHETCPEAAIDLEYSLGGRIIHAIGGMGRSRGQ